MHGSYNAHLCEISQPCPGKDDFYAEQCAAFNSRHYKGALHEWEPHPDPLNPCTLRCKALNNGTETALIATLSPTARDGTRCRPGTLDMCVNGECMVSNFPSSRLPSH